MQKHLTALIFVGWALGIVAGFLIHENVTDPARLTEIAGYFSIITDIFLRLIKMIIAPLVLTMLISGIAHLGDGASMGRIGLKTLLWFVSASIVSLALGALLASGLIAAGWALPPPIGELSTTITSQSLGLKEFLTHVFPRSIAEAMAQNEILQIVVFAIFAGTAAIALKEKARPMVELAESISHVMLKITGYVMLSAPLAVFAAIAAVIAKNGIGVLDEYGAFVGGFYGSLLLLWAVLLVAGAVVLGPAIFRLIGLIREPLLLAFSTASSEAAYPKTLEQLEKFGVSRKVAGFVLPLGYSFNLDGSMMYCTFATLFISHAYGIHLTPAQIVTMLLLLMVTSKGMAGVPRASLVVIAATLSFFGIPEAGLALILAVDQFLDMGRSATNVVGNSVATAVVARWEGELAPAGNNEARKG